MTDTHPLVWFAAARLRKLSKRARAAFEAYESGRLDLYVPMPVVLETWLLAQGGVIRVETSLERWWRRLRNPRLHFQDISAEDVFAASALGWHHRDLYDRLIVATALALGLPLLTADSAISDWGGVEVVW
ncbi:MAG: type II toxin-antitoxin system VapC family toxin [Myxococcota bacterium]